MSTVDQLDQDTPAAEVDRRLDAAGAAAPEWGRWAPRSRAEALDAVADALDAGATDLVAAAMTETGLPEARLTGEVKRTTVQLRMFAGVLRDGSYLRIVIDRSDPGFALGTKPDLRRWLVPLGPVLVFAASNFPFAFSVAGGDTAAALAAGCPVLLKAHPGHPGTSRLTADIVRSALRHTGAPEGTFDLITGQEAGVRALRDPRVTAAAFTGSVAGGRALFDIASSRKSPIPFYGELGSVNPAVVTAEAAHERGQQIAEGFVASFTLGAGQFCTKPGVLLLPRGTDLSEHVAELADGVPPARMLTAGIAQRYRERLGELVNVPGVKVLLNGREHADQSGVPAVSPTLFHAGSVHNLHEHREVLLEENFGPSAVIAEYTVDDDLAGILEAVGGSLTVTVQTSSRPEESERARLSELLQLAARCSGRVVFNEWPTGVAVTAAQHHGGPYPATTAVLHTSVGTAAIERFLRPVTYQNAPDALLPRALQDANPLGLPRTVNEPGDSFRADP
ncbi:aldehyde dehydrogenase (NADP(+)) [Amycolatopsis pithecellobii]|uniref:Aldehyde dehydrogenase family protein n=1 Tax=Amycolatopsis pithecellobii TaxID=664692 RepID=A0A6N7Z2V9_9PSEU|nr:aldehyde dehydrogenase (NADP(+)) [Amycolatopsis pithecellobii]MTD53106.1 aldehyde dehydrogenase family protein [Amycolatopsis pithecellobii]